MQFDEVKKKDGNMNLSSFPEDKKKDGNMNLSSFPEDKKTEDRTQLTFNSDGSISLPEEIGRDLERKKFRKQESKKLDIWDEPEDFSDEKFNVGDSVSGFNLYRNGEGLAPLKFSNGQSQEDVVKQVLDCISDGKKVIFIRGVCGTGKSAIALNIAKELGKSSIIVPGKALQRQYWKDYSHDSYVLKNDYKKLKIRIITGRDNHRCLYSKQCTANDAELPCKIEIKESNFAKLREYLRENPKVKNDLELKSIRRMSVAPVCPYWSPIVPSEFDLSIEAKKRPYDGLGGIRFIIYNRKKGCSYYNQFNSYLDAEAIIFNSAKYKLESVMNRKPETKVEIIDECDEFLDSFSNVKRINFSRLSNALNNIFPEDENLTYNLDKLSSTVIDILKDTKIKDSILNNEIFPIKDTQVYDLLQGLIDNQKLLEDADEDNYVHKVDETAKDFEEFFDDTYVSFSLDERGLSASVVTTNLAKKFQNLLDKSNAIVMMSGTIHSEKVLKNIFGIEDFVVIDAETINQGEVESKRTGFEIDCKYANFQNGQNTRQDYLMALDKAIDESVKPTLVHVNAFDDLPSEREKEDFDLVNVMSKQKFLSLQEISEEMVEKFKKKQISVLFTTKCNRGVDFPKDQCNSIVFTKYPNPNVRSVFWKILNRTHPAYYWEFYKDKANREFLQKMYRGIRSHDDHIFVLSPDLRILNAVDGMN